MSHDNGSHDNGSHDDGETLVAWLGDDEARVSDGFDVHAIVDQTLGIVPDAEHVSLTVRDRRDSYRTLASTSELGTELDRLQYDLKQGPCVDAVTESDWYRTGDLGHDPRWPSWGPRASLLGVASLLSVRLVADGESFGALNMYSCQPGRFADRDEVDQALIWATQAAYALSAARTVAHLETALASRHTIGVAQGMLMERYGLDERSSFMLLRRLSSHRNVKVRDVAADFLRTRKLPEQP